MINTTQDLRDWLEYYAAGNELPEDVTEQLFKLAEQFLVAREQSMALMRAVFGEYAEQLTPDDEQNPGDQAVS